MTENKMFNETLDELKTQCGGVTDPATLRLIAAAIVATVRLLKKPS